MSTSHRIAKIVISSSIIAVGISVAGIASANATTKVSTPTPSPKPQTVPTPAPSVAPKVQPIMTAAVPIPAPKPTVNPIAAPTQSTSIVAPITQLLQSQVGVEASKIIYQKATNTPTAIKAATTTVQNLGGPTQALTTLNTMLKSAGNGLLDLIDSIGTFAEETGL